MSAAETRLPAMKIDLLGKRVQLYQPVHGFRVSIDAVLLAASVPAVDGEQTLDVGSGTGAAAFCLGARVPGVRVRGLEIQDDLVALARASALINGAKDKIDFSVGDLLDPPTYIQRNNYNHIFANPPYMKAKSGQVPNHPSKALATIEGNASLIDWLDFCVTKLVPKGTFTVVHRYDRLSEILDHFHRFPGRIVVKPLITKVGSDPKRVLVQVTKGISGPILRVPGLILHERTGVYTSAAEAILRHAQQLVMSEPENDYG